MQKKRKCKIYKEKEKNQQQTAKRFKRENEEYKQQEKVRQRTTKRLKRENEEYKQQEKVQQRTTKRLKRENEEYKQQEKVQQRTTKRLKRENEEYKQQEKVQQRTTKRLKRENEEYKQQEKVQQRTTKRLKRENEEFKQQEKVQQRTTKRLKRENEKFKQQEKVQQRTTKRLKRENEEFKQQEKVQQRTTKRLKRKNEEFKQQEKVQQRTAKRFKRENEEFKQQEKIQQKAWKRSKRKNKEYQQQERNKLKASIEIKQRNITFKVNERNKQKLKMKEKRENIDFKYTEQINDKECKRRLRLNEIYKFRENTIKSLKNKKDAISKAKLKFIKKRKDTPNKICACCETLWFSHSVLNLSTTKRHSKLPDDIFNEKIINNDTTTKICRTCDKNIRKGKIPQLATSNGLKFPLVPNCVKNLSDIEAAMVSPFIPFSQIRPLKPHSLNPQLSLKGSVVHVPVEINEMVNVLPRSFTSLDMTQVIFKRNISHKSEYMNEFVRPAFVCEALDYLSTTPLYKEFDIKINETFFKQYEKCSDIDFIVEQNDNQFKNDINTYKNKVLNDGDDKITFALESESDTDIEEEISNEVLLLDRNAESAKLAQIIAPGQGNKPVSWKTPHLNALCHPRIFGGCDFSTDISDTARIKSEIRRADRRACTPSYLLYLANQKMHSHLSSQINVNLRQIKKNESLTAEHVLQKGFIDDAIRHDVGYKILKQIRLSPAYLEKEKKKILGMIRQLGKPTFFLTLSAAEKLWPELMQMLAQILDKKSITLEEALNLDDHTKTDYIRRDPITCALYFDNKFRAILNYLQGKDGPFLNHPVIDFYFRIEFQLRGSPHAHCFLWLQNAPNYNANDIETHEKCIEFIDKFIACKYIENNPFIGVQRHKHTFTCNKGNKNKTKCRFDFPLPVMPQTMILEPLQDVDDETMKSARKNLQEIRNLTYSFYKKSSKLIEFNDILEKLDLTESEYILAIRSSIKRTRVFLKRKSTEVGINCYNADILNLFEANMDIQFITNPYSCASYIVNYVSKVDSGLSKFLRQCVDEINNGNNTITERLRKYANAFLNGNLMSAQEAAYQVLSLVVAKGSRKVVYINTGLKEERVRMLKSNKELQLLDPTSQNIFKEDCITKYEKRSNAKSNLCLADFVAFSKNVNKQEENESDNDSDDNNNESNNNNDDNENAIRNKPLIIRFRNFNQIQDPFNYYREQVMLYLPWRSEENDIIIKDCKILYEENINLINQNKSKYCAINEAIINEALENVYLECEDIQEEEINEFNKNKLDKDQEIDISDIISNEKTIKNSICNRYTAPAKLPEEDIFKLMEKLNAKQREIVMHTLHCIKTNQLPFHIFLSGSAGVGKSTVINAIYQTASYYYSRQPDKDNKNEYEKREKLHVLLCAPSGKAAFLIGGVTLHTAFKLPVSQNNRSLVKLDHDIANSMRAELFDLKLLIIDEISMVGARTLSHVDSRLQDIKGINKPFGGISVLVVGDLHQLPPVRDVAVFKPSKCSSTSIIANTCLWDIFQLYELTEVMRQKDDKTFITALNNLANKNMTNEDIQLIRSRCVSENNIPNEAIRLYATNILVDAYNINKIENQNGTEFVSEAHDFILANISEEEKNKQLKALKTKKTSDTFGLPHKIIFKTGIKYMLTTNIDVQDGLVNGACGILREITLDINSNEISKVWIDFNNNNVGNKARNTYKQYALENKIDIQLTPILKESKPLNISEILGYQIIRKQFPIVPAEAVTIHKSQGQTYEHVCLDFRRSQRITKSMLYVA